MNAAVPLVESWEWRERAACRGKNAKIFFGDASEDAAKAICRGCEVRPDCLDYSLTLSFDTEGVWGGLNRSERDKTRKMRRKASA